MPFKFGIRVLKWTLPHYPLLMLDLPPSNPKRPRIINIAIKLNEPDQSNPDGIATHSTRCRSLYEVSSIAASIQFSSTLLQIIRYRHRITDCKVHTAHFNPNIIQAILIATLIVYHILLIP